MIRQSLIGATAVLSVACGSIEEPTEFYESRAALVADGAIDHGWVPPWLPNSARAIHESHNLDTNEVWMRFRLDPDDMVLVEECVPSFVADVLRASGPRLTRPQWWVGWEPYDWEGYDCKWRFGEKARAASLVVAQSEGVALYWEE